MPELSSDRSSRFSSCYRFFDTLVEIQSDSAAFVEQFAALYGRFAVPNHESPQAIYSVSAADGVVVVEGETVLETDATLLFQRALERALDGVAGRVRSHLMIHAGALSWNGRGLVMPAYSYHGKTTLILELTGRGFRFLSDEIAAFDRQSGNLAPFPRSLRIWPSTLALLNLAEVDPGGRSREVSRRDKLVFDIEQLLPDSLGEACRPAWLVVLANPGADPNAITQAERSWYLVLDRTSEAFFEQLRNVEGVVDLALVPEASEGVLRLRIERGAGAMERVRQVCRDQNVGLLNEIKGGERVPDFTRTPVLEPISPMEAAIELVRRFRAGPGSALLEQEHKGRTARLLLEVVEHGARMDCYRLQVGRLEAMADLICDLVSRNER